MRWSVPLIPFLLVACADEGTFDVVNGLPTDDVGEDSDGSGSDDGTDDGSDDDSTDDDDTDGGQDSDDPLNPDAIAWHHVIGEIGLLGPGQGFDLDGDGEVDNALGAFARYVGDLLDGLVRGSDTVGIVQTWGVEDGDNRASVGVITGVDTDGDTRDNFDGDEVFAVSEGLRSDGRAEIAASTRVRADGGFDARIPAGEFTLLGFTLPTATDIFISGVVSKGGIEGRIGTAVPLEVVVDLASQSGIDFIVGLIEDAADVDTDGDNQPDAISLSLSFSGPSCSIEDAVSTQPGQP